MIKKTNKTIITLLFAFGLFQINAQNPSTTPTDSLLKHSKSESNDVVVLSEIQLSEDGQDQNISGLLNSGNDPFESAIRYNLSSYRFRQRGYDNKYQSVYINGVKLNDTERGVFSFSLLGGLNDAVKNRESSLGFETTNYSYGGLGGSVNIDTRASSYRKGTKLSLLGGNFYYNGRLMATHSSGLKSNGWAYSITGSHRMTNDDLVYVEGLSYDGWSLGIAIEKIINDNHSLSLNAYYAPTKRGTSSASTQEAYDLKGSNYYNPNWGYQDGKKRNARVAESNSPVAILSHDWTISDQLKQKTSLGFVYNRYGKSSLNWYKAADPRPDYYRRLPSYYEQSNPAVEEMIANAWKTDDSYSQINWDGVDGIYQTNLRANRRDTSARYILQNYHSDQLAFNFATTTNWNPNEKLETSGGLEASYTKGMHFKTLEDLLGANYYYDIDQYAERDFSDDETLQNDLNNPDRKVTEGDVFGYNYNIFVQKADVWASGKYTVSNQINVYAAASLTGTRFYREGLMKNGRAPENSYGVGEKHNFIDYSVKGGLTYKLTGRHIFTLNGLYETNAPTPRNSYVSASIKDDAIDGLKSEKVASFDCNYIMRYSFINLRATAYYTSFTDQSSVRSFYFDNYKTYVNQAMVGINKTHKGIELGFNAKITPIISTYGALAVGEYKYTSRPTAITSYENGSKEDTTQTIFLKNFFESGTPQIASTLGLNIALPKYWYLNMNANYAGKAYISIFPERRTSGAISGDMTDDEIHKIIDQEELNGGFTFDASIGKSFRINDYYIYFNASVKNILDNQDIQTGGYEQTRLSSTTGEYFPSKYYYAYGRTFMFYLGFSF